MKLCLVGEGSRLYSGNRQGNWILIFTRKAIFWAEYPIRWLSF